MKCNAPLLALSTAHGDGAAALASKHNTARATHDAVHRVAVYSRSVRTRPPRSAARSVGWKDR